MARTKRGIENDAEREKKAATNVRGGKFSKQKGEVQKYQSGETLQRGGHNRDTTDD